MPTKRAAGSVREGEKGKKALKWTLKVFTESAQRKISIMNMILTHRK
jgi:hypothetical protein